MTPGRYAHVVDDVHVLPVVHERLEYADQVRLALATLRPEAIAVEIPSSLEERWLAAVDRLPAISVLLYENTRGETVYLPVHPADPMVEAARWARAHDLKLRCADLDVDGYADYRDPVPDPYTVIRLGPAGVYRAFKACEHPVDPRDPQREASMAFHARQLRAEGARRILLLCGMHHAERIAAQLAVEQATPLTPPRRSGLRLVHLHPTSLGEVLPEIPFYVAAYEMRRLGLPPAPPDPVEVDPGRSYGPFRVLSGGRQAKPERLQQALSRAAREAALPQEGDASVPGPLDRLRLQWTLLRESEAALAATAPDERVEPWQRENLARFSRNLALGSGTLVPDLYDLLCAARSCVSDNFAWELHRLAVGYPHQATRARDLPTAEIRAEEMYDGVRRIRLQRRTRRAKRPDWRTLLKRRRRAETRPGEWLEGFDGEGICSYPPEDLVIEDFGRYLKRRGKSVLSEEQARTVPFSTSVLDGIDVRETIRHWTEGKIFVRELGRVPGDVGSVVMIFDTEEQRYPYCQTWLGEHNQESDMAFYATEPAQAVVGPGICRVTYGGLMLSHPPLRMADVWTDADYRMAESQAEVLLLAALDYSTERIVVHVAPRPPRPLLHQLATRLGLKILHLPLGTLSPSTVRRIRVAHVLSGHDKREIAKDYIW